MKKLQETSSQPWLAGLSPLTPPMGYTSTQSHQWPAGLSAPTVDSRGNQEGLVRNWVTPLSHLIQTSYVHAPHAISLLVIAFI